MDVLMTDGSKQIAPVNDVAAGDIGVPSLLPLC